MYIDARYFGKPRKNYVSTRHEYETRREGSAEFQGVDPAAEEAVVAYFREMDI
jgi:hypothetical protein